MKATITLINKDIPLDEIDGKIEEEVRNKTISDIQLRHRKSFYTGRFIRSNEPSLDDIMEALSSFLSSFKDHNITYLHHNVRRIFSDSKAIWELDIYYFLK